MSSKALGLVSLFGLCCVQLLAQAQERIPDDLVISMQRGNCEGGCPVYRILIFANGDVIWHGRGRVAKLGVLLSRVEPGQLRTLIEHFEAIDFLHTEDIYGYRGPGCQASTPDTPMVILSLSMGGAAKTISHHDGCVGKVSSQLTTLENSIDEAVGSVRWISGRTSANKH